MTTPASRTARRAVAALEALEGRRYLAASPVVLNSAGLLYVAGSSLNDKVFVFPDKRDAGTLILRRNGADWRFAAGDVKDIQVKVGWGDDRVELAANVTARAMLYGVGGNDTLLGGAAADVLVGGAGDDSLDPRAGDDLLYGGDGKDTLHGSAGADTVDGGPDGDYFGMYDGDTIPAEAADPVMLRSKVLNAIGTDGNDLIYIYRDAADPTKLVVNFNGAESRFVEAEITTIYIEGNAGNDQIEVAQNDNITLRAVIEGGDGNDALQGANGDDVISGGAGNDSLTGGLGDDFLEGNAGDDVLNGGAGQDFLDGGAGANTVDADDDDLKLRGVPTGVALDESGVLTIGGTSGDDTVLVTRQLDKPDELAVTLNGVTTTYAVTDVNAIRVEAGDGNDHVTLTDDLIDGLTSVQPSNAVHAAATLFGGNGDDLLEAGAGADKIIGGEGDDTLRGARSADTLFGGAGNDLMSGDKSHSYGAGQLYAANVFFGGEGNDSASGLGTSFLGDGDDTGSAFSGTLSFGQAGNDTLPGHNRDGRGYGSSIMFGGSGNDAFTIPYLGNDAYGGTGDDQTAVSLFGWAAGGPGFDTYAGFIYRDGLENPWL